MENAGMNDYNRDLIIYRLLDSKRDTRFALRAYEFISLIFSVLEKAGRAHFSAKEIIDTTVKTATILYGPVAEFVLEDMGIKTTEDIGDIISNLIDLKIMTRDNIDSRYKFLFFPKKSLFSKKNLKPLNIEKLKVFEDT
jgi:uncharacterized repeat protein (TIGR04138 family)